MTTGRITADALLVTLVDTLEHDGEKTVIDGGHLFHTIEDRHGSGTSRGEIARLLGRLRDDGFVTWEENQIVRSNVSGPDDNVILNAMHFRVTGAGRGHALQLRAAENKSHQPTTVPNHDGVENEHAITFVSLLHPRVQAKSGDLFANGHHAPAVDASVKAVRSLLRDRTGLTIDGNALITQTFSTTKPLLRFNHLESATDRNEQVGFMELLQGYWKHVRHVLAHSDDNERLDEATARELLVMASWICRSIDRCEATVPTS